MTGVETGGIVVIAIAALKISEKLVDWAQTKISKDPMEAKDLHDCLDKLHTLATCIENKPPCSEVMNGVMSELVRLQGQTVSILQQMLLEVGKLQGRM